MIQKFIKCKTLSGYSGTCCTSDDCCCDDDDRDNKVTAIISAGVAASVRGLWRLHTEDDTR